MAENSFAQSAFQQSFEEWLRQAEPALVSCIHAAAIPHTFNLTLLTLLLGDANLSTTIAHLERANLVYEAGEGYWALHASVRAFLQQTWRSQRMDDYRKANGLLADYFTKNRRRSSDDAERAYHLLAVDTVQGLGLLILLFENAWADRRLGQAEQLVRYAEEQAPLLDPGQRAWIRTLRARLERANQRYAASEAILQDLTSAENEPQLRAQALLDLGELLLETQRWREAFAAYREAQHLFVRLGDNFNSAKAWEGLGLAYVHLATILGGLQEGTRHFQTRWRALRHRLQHAPFILYRWFSRRSARLPSLYYGTNYQDWLIIRVLYAAIDAFESALLDLRLTPADGRLPVARVRADITIWLADLHHRVDHWAQAGQAFAELAENPMINQDAGLLASLNLVRGRASLARGRLDEARQYLHSAQAGLAPGGTDAAVMLERLLGDVELAARQNQQAVAHYLACGRIAADRGDLLTVTDICALLRLVAEREPLPDQSRKAIADFDQTVTQRAYVARFPSGLSERFRMRATGIAAPIAYLLITLLVFILPFAFGAVELIFGAAFTYPGPLSDLAIGLLIFSGIPLGSWWLYESIYVAAGMRFVQRTPVATISDFQPKYLVTLPDSVLVRDENGQSVRRTWETFSQIVIIDRAFVGTPIALFSRWVLRGAAEGDVVIEGVFRHYRLLQQDILARLRQRAQHVQIVDLAFSFLRSGWTILALLLTLLLIPVSVFSLLDTTYPRPHWRYVSAKAGFYLHVIDEGGNLQVVDGWNPRNLRVLARADLGGDALSVMRQGNLAYVAAGAQGLSLVDLSNVSDPRPVGQWNSPGSVQDVLVKGDFVFVADGTRELPVVSVKEPTAVVRVGQVPLPGAYRLAMDGDLLFVAGDGETLASVDVTDPSAPRLLDQWRAPEMIMDMAATDGWLVVADGASGVIVLAVSKEGTLAEIGRYDSAGFAQAVALSTRFAFVADGADGVLVVDVQADPPQLVQRLATPSPALDVMRLEASGYTFVALGSGGLLPVYFQNPDEPPILDPLVTTLDAVHLSAIPSYKLPVATLLYEFFYWARLFFPIIGLLRLLGNQTAVRRHIGHRSSWRAEALTVLMLSFLFALSAWHILNLTI